MREKKDHSFYPLTLPGIKQYGIEKWISDFKPVLPGDEFQKGYETIFKAFADAVIAQKKDTHLYWSGAVNYKIPMLLAEAYFRYRCLVSLKDRGISQLFLDRERDIDAAVDTSVRTVFSEEQRYCLDPKERLLESLRLMKLNFNSYGLQKAFTCLTPDYGCCVITDPENRDVKTFAKERKLSLQCLRPSLFLPSKGYLDSMPESIRKESEDFIELFCKGLFENDPDAELFFGDNLRKRLVDTFAGTVWILDSIRNKLSDKKLGTLLVQSVTNPESRMLAAVWKWLGGTTVGFCHGNGYLTSYGGSDVNNGTHLVVDKYVVSSTGEKRLTEFIRDKIKSPLAVDDEIVPLNTPYYRDIFDSMKNDPEVKEIKTVMFVGYPMDYHFDPYLVEHNTLSYTHVALRAMKVLRKAGYRIIYKEHPDTLSQTEGFFDDYVDEIITENFNKVYQKADCLMFITPYSTTFGFSAMTKIPMVYFNNLNFDFWEPELKKLLDKRAVPFNIKSRTDGFLEFSEDELLDCIRTSLNKVDHEVVEKYAF